MYYLLGADAQRLWLRSIQKVLAWNQLHSVSLSCTHWQTTTEAPPKRNCSTGTLSQGYSIVSVAGGKQACPCHHEIHAFQTDAETRDTCETRGISQTHTYYLQVPEDSQFNKSCDPEGPSSLSRTVWNGDERSYCLKGTRSASSSKSFCLCQIFSCFVWPCEGFKLSWALTYMASHDATIPFVQPSTFSAF